MSDTSMRDMEASDISRTSQDPSKTPPSVSNPHCDENMESLESDLTVQGDVSQNGTVDVEATQTSMPLFDPKALLNPKATVATTQSSQSPSRKAKPVHAGRDSESPAGTYVSLIEKAHGIERREERPVKRPRMEVSTGDEPKKKGTFESGNATILGQYIKDKRHEGDQLQEPVLASRLAMPPPAHTPTVATTDSTIDLTADDDDEVVCLSSKHDEEVCLGKLERSYLNAHQIPCQRRGGPSGSRDSWPAIKVTFQRRPGNDLMILVNDGQGKSFATLDPKTSSALQPLLDGQKQGSRLRIDAKVEPRKKRPGEVAGMPTHSQLNLLVILYSPKSKADSLGTFLSRKGIWLRMPPRFDNNIVYYNPQAPKVAKTRLSEGSTPRIVSGIINAGTGYYTRTQEEIRHDVLSMFDSLTKSEDLPQKEANPIITTKLLSHQKQALWFMRDRESGSDANCDDKRSLWKTRMRRDGVKVFYNIITGYEQASQPKPCLGGILADMMGLGKTLSILSLITDTLEEAKAWADQEPGSDGLRKVKTTLLVSPLSTTSNWQEQIGQHLKKNSIKYYLYHGPNRSQDLDELAQYDIIISSYNTAATEFGTSGRQKRDAMRQLDWFRIVLDEAHMIRNQQTGQSLAICGLSANRRWAVTGTPVQNRLDDLGALIKFLRIRPFDEKGSFTTYIMTPFKQADPEIIPKLRLLVDTITLRRLKDKIHLPDRQDFIVHLDFSDDERALYDWFALDSANRVKAMTANRTHGIGGRAYAHVLRAILRLRLICAHGSDLLSDEDMKLTEGLSYGNAIDLGDDEDEDKPALSPKQAYDMLQLMRESDEDRCMMCNTKIGEENPDEELAEKAQNTVGHMTPCFHILCPTCLPLYQKKAQDKLTSDGYMDCPTCDQYVKYSFFDFCLDKMKEDEEMREELRNNPKLAKQMIRYSGPHTKTKALIQSLIENEQWSAAHPEERPIKSVVFSGWTSHLDLIETGFKEHLPSVQYTRLDGRMSRAARTIALRVFREDPAIHVILVSIGAGGLGLNLTTASRVYVMEPQYNPAAEAQAVDRVHRLGQEREVIIRRFIMNDSFELKMLELQRKKMKLAEISLGEKGARGKAGREEESRRKLEDLKSLFR
ncbi:hypothetical protein EJ05DRAFT_497017 [Pseudovirgaria hyperparasitica]|uniref:SNF2 family helicase/ATPase-like protein n=1 Tax=Pseudovirgaria hyperparasitica TaxID=470096 RepID=A0A6A6WJ46_9PEZI|nr:uncharacterized protein EJ05DRAFT_497017 [Pseudovirgaria hyperparasitica]KAF2762150.1 hypothetical protein EJ05DRAFT_497017 [Pseudovirgaria hyperparasitica]